MITTRTSDQELAAPTFCDVTLRDGNQALAKQMTPEQKLLIFNWLMALGVKHIEIGYPVTSRMDFQACQAIAEKASENTTIVVLARCNNSDIDCAIKTLSSAQRATPRLHTFIGMSPFHMKNVLEKEPEQVKAMAIAGVRRAKDGLMSLGKPTQIQFSPEHFGACQTNLEWVIEALKEIVAAGADVINLPNTVERTRPAIFAQMVEKVVAALPKSVIVSVHCHNDLGMATATTVEAYFAGARQLECTLNGLGERAGNTNLYEAAVALSLNGVPTNLNLDQIYQAALRVSRLIGQPIPAKAPIIGCECLYHRSGIHQHGAHKTFERPQKAYLPYDPALVGRAGDEQLRFTSQSGYTAVLAIVQEAGMIISETEARRLQPALKEAAQSRGELTSEEIVAAYQKYAKLKLTKLQVDPKDIKALVSDAIRDRGQEIWQRVFVRAIAGEHPSAVISLRRNGDAITKEALGDGPVDAAFKAIRAVTGLEPEIVSYAISNLTPGGDSLGEVICGLRLNERRRDGKSTGPDIVVASVDAYLDALNQLLTSENSG